MATDYRQDERDREVAGDVVESTWGELPGKHLGRLRTQISRAANRDVTNPVYRLRRWLRAGRRAGLTRVQAYQVVTDLLAVIEEEWPAAELPFAAAAEQEQALDGAEDVAEVCALGRPGDPERLMEYARAARASAAAQLVAAAAAEREAGSRLRAAA
jgi:hypothetical protein